MGHEKVHVVPCSSVGGGDWAAPSSDHLIAAVPAGEDTANVSIPLVGWVSMTGLVDTNGSSRCRLIALRPGAAPAAVTVWTWCTSGERPCAAQLTSTAIRLRSSV